MATKKSKPAPADAPAAAAPVAAPPTPPAPPPEPISLQMSLHRVRNGFIAEMSIGPEGGYRERQKSVARNTAELTDLVRRWAEPPAAARKPARPTKPAANVGG